MSKLENNIHQAIKDFDGIKNSIQGKGVEVADGTPTSVYGEKVTEVYDKGYNKGYDKGYSDGEEEFWRDFTNNGDRKTYSCAFYEANFEGKTIPKGLLKPKASIREMFRTYQGKTLPKGLDFSDAFSVNPYTSDYMVYMFMWSLLEEIYDIGLQATGQYKNVQYRGTFTQCQYLKKIEVLRTDATTQYTESPFGGCKALESLTIEGVIGQNGFNVSACPLNHDSLMSIINALEDKTSDTSGTTWSITIGSTNKAKLTDGELQIAANKGWGVN